MDTAQTVLPYVPLYSCEGNILHILQVHLTLNYVAVSASARQDCA